SPRLLRRLWRCARCHRPGEAAQGLGSLTKDRVDRREKPHVGGPGGPLVSRTSASTMTSPPFFPNGAPRLVILTERAERARRAASIVIASPPSTSASVPPVAASGATWPTTRP